MRLFRTALALGLVVALVEPSGAVEPAPDLTIKSVQEAIQAALARSPMLQANRARLEIGRGEVQQAGLWPNPELSVELENFGGSEASRGLDAAEITYGLGQPIELGGKRSARVRLAEADLNLAQIDTEALRLDLIRDVARAYTEFTASALTIAIEEERAQLADELLRAAEARVDAGKEPLIQRRKAEVAGSTAKIAVAKARRDHDSARRALITLIGAPGAELEPNQAWFEAVETAEPQAHPQMLAGTPDLERLDAAIDRSQAALAAERANAWPDLTVGAGVRQFREDDSTAFLVGISIPLPFFDRNQGKRFAALSGIAQAEAEGRQARLTLDESYRDAQNKLNAASEEALLLRSETMPAAEQAFRFAREGYVAGKFSFLEVLDAQRALFDAKAQLNEALRDFHLRQATVHRLSGRGAVFDGGTP